MKTVVACPACRQSLRVPEEMLGKALACLRCGAKLVARADGTVVAIAPAGKKPAGPAKATSGPARIDGGAGAITARARPDRPASSPRDDPAAEPASPLVRPAEPAPTRKRPVAGRRGFAPFGFKVAIREDSRCELKGTAQARIKPEGLELQRGQSRLVLPVGSPTKHLGGARLAVNLDGRRIELVVTKFGAYQQRLARAVVDFLNGDRQVLDARDYKLPWYLFVPAVLPLGIPMMTLGGAVPAGLGFGLAAACFAVVQRERMSVAARIAVSLGLAFLGYVGLAGFLVAMAVFDPFGQSRSRESARPPEQSSLEQQRVISLPPEARELLEPKKPRREQEGQPVGPAEQPLPEPKKQPIDMSKVKPLQAGGRLLPAHEQPVADLTFSPDSQTLVTAASDEIKLWNPATGEVRATLPGGRTVGYTPDGTKLLFGAGNALQVRDLARGEQLPFRFLGNGFAVPPDGGRVVVGGESSVLSVYDLVSGQRLASWPGFRDYPTDLAFSPDGKTVAVACHGQRGAVLCDAATGRVLRTCDALPGGGNGVALVAFADGGRLVAATAPDKSHVLLCETATGRQRHLLREPDSGWVWRIAVAPNGKLLAVGSDAGVVSLWDMVTGRGRTVLRGGTWVGEGIPVANAISALAFSPDGKTLAAGTRLGLVKLWDLPRVLGRVGAGPAPARTDPAVKPGPP